MAHQASLPAPKKSGVLASCAHPMLAQPFGPAEISLPQDMVDKQSQDQVTWDEHSCEAFKHTQVSLSGCQTITLPQPGDQLWIVTDGAVTHGVGATLYVTRNGQPRLAGFFSAKLRDRQVKWLPCEIEALSIALDIKHFSPYIIQSQHKACILTDS